MDLYHYSNGAPNNVFAAVSLISTNTFSDDRNTGFVGATTYQKNGFGRAAWLVNTFAYNTVLTGLQKSALQIAIWKAEYEDASTSSANKVLLTGGTTTFSGIADPNVVTQAQAYLQASITAGGGSSYAMSTATWVNYAGSAQHQIRAVPEPASMAICATALVALSGMTWHRRRQAKVSQA